MVKNSNRLFKKKITLINILSNLLLQIVTLISGFIIPKIILLYFGSNVNGLVSSLNQFLSYITLVEGGVTGVITANLYKPLVNKDYEKVSSIVNTSSKFYKKVGFIFVLYSIIIGLFYPLFFETEFSYFYVFSLTLILSLNLLIQYMFSLSLKTLLNADKKVYIVAITQIFVIIINFILAIVSVKLYPSIHVFKLISGFLFLLQPIVFSKYIKKNYIINDSKLVDNDLVKNRWNGFAINVAAFIHFSTDISILTIFTDLKTVSIYSVYALVTTGLKTIVSSISSGINPTIGHLFAKEDDNETKNKFSLYEDVIIFLVYFLFCVAGLLITPFVIIYTYGINDADYNQPLFGILLLVSEALYLIKLPHLNLAYSANKFKEITKPAFIEAGLNIIISIFLVKKFGLCGITIGTIIGMLYRMIFQVNFTKKILKNYKPSDFYKKNLLFIFSSMISLTICLLFITKVKYTIFSWLVHSFIYISVFLIIYFIVGLIFYRNEMKSLCIYLKIYKEGEK